MLQQVSQVICLKEVCDTLTLKPPEIVILFQGGREGNKGSQVKAGGGAWQLVLCLLQKVGRGAQESRLHLQQ